MVQTGRLKEPPPPEPARPAANSRRHQKLKVLAKHGLAGSSASQQLFGIGIGKIVPEQVLLIVHF